MDIISRIKSGLLFFDGAMGTELQKKGLGRGELPERFCLEHPEILEEIHLSYLEAGSDVISACTFGANSLKYGEDELRAVIGNALDCAENAVKKFGKKDKYIALDIGPLGKILKPFGDLGFEDAVEIFKNTIKLAGDRADVIIIETMNDAFETKAAVLAAKEASKLPIFVSNVYDENEKLMTGADAVSMIAMLEGLGVDAVGMNCSLGPGQMNKILKTFAQYSSLPVLMMPNAGLPKVECGRTVFDVSAEEYSAEMKRSAELGARILGGCCGTDPEYIRMLTQSLCSFEPKEIEKKHRTLVSSYTHFVEFSDAPVIIGERINPTGKKRVKQALREGDLAYIQSEAVYQQQSGAEILDVNCGLPELDEKSVMRSVVESLQSVTDAPLQIDTSDPEALESALRIYGGKAMINSVNGKTASMNAVFPLQKKYGGVVVALTLDEDGIPDTAEGRVRIAEKIIKTAESYGIDKKDIVVDTLTMAVSTDKTAADVTIRAIEGVRRLGVHTVLGVSNISFGLPHRDYVNAEFTRLALKSGLNSAIMNPHSERMMSVMRNTYADFPEAPADLVKFAEDIIEEVLSLEDDKTAVPIDSSSLDLRSAIISGLSSQAGAVAGELLREKAPLEIINEYIVPALDKVGAGFEAGEVYLPRLLMSAEAAKAAFSAVKEALSSQGGSASKETVIVATVRGDIHDIGKNIVRTLLENYGYRVIDLGKDVPEQSIAEAVCENKVRLVGLSALMTTTVPSMASTIKLLRSASPETKIMVGGAVMSEEYAKMIDADFYSKDAMGAVRIAESFFRAE